LWTPLLVGGVAWIGEPFAAPLQSFFGSGWTDVPLAAIVLFFLYRFCLHLATQTGRARLAALVSRIWRWEYWPAWLFYLPLLPWIAYLSLRNRGWTTITAANPAIPHGGIVGGSKFDILSRLPREWIVPTERIESADPTQRRERLEQIIRRDEWSFPLILKPDVGERGAGLKLIRTLDEGGEYLSKALPAMLVQTYHPGPHEAGIFYYRFPGEPHGCIFSITDKKFPILSGDGQSSIEELIRRHPRFRMQARRFLARFNGQAESILEEGETLRLAVAGNHCQGTEFRDGAHLITPTLEKRIDEIARSFDGFFFGRFDVRYADADALRSGCGFSTVELNGASSESTNLYDPTQSLLRAYRILFRQWKILYEIGRRNRDRGHPVTPPRELVRVIRRHYRSRSVDWVSD